MNKKHFLLVVTVIAVAVVCFVIGSYIGSNAITSDASTPEPTEVATATQCMAGGPEFPVTRLGLHVP